MTTDQPPESEEPESPTVELPDIRVVSVYHDADRDRIAVSHDEDLDPHHALGLLLHGLWLQLQNVEMFDFEYADDDDED